MIVESQPENEELRSVVVRLGGFHTQMSFLGSIGHLMSGSGIENVLEVVYASNTVGHILSGKAVARAIRAHFIVDASLNSLLAAKVLDVKLPIEDAELDLVGSAVTTDTMNTTEVTETNTEVSSSTDVQELTDLMHNILSGTATRADVENNDVLDNICRQLKCQQNKLCSRTASLWLQYMEMIDLLRKFVKAERLGDWDLHLQSLHEMLPYFAASGQVYT